MTPASSFHLGAHTLPYRGEPLDRALRGIAGAGFRNAGLFPEHAGSDVFGDRPSPATAGPVRREFERAGLTPVTMFARPGAFRDAAALTLDLKLCEALGMPLLQAAGPWPDAGGRRKPEMAWFREVRDFLDVLTAGAAEAERRGVTIVLKPHRGVTATGADLVALVDLVGAPSVRVCWDAGNVRFYEGLDSEEDLERSGVAPLVRSVCVKDHRGTQGDPTFPVPGDGDVDHDRLLSVLARAGFAGPLLVERVDQETVAATDSALARARTFLESAVSRVRPAGAGSGGGTPC